jgi:SAM-dependent methyltransferase
MMETTMNDVTRHYDSFLAEHYCWMAGVPFDEKVAEQQDLLLDLGIRPGGRAIDLGSGPGFQALALAKIGFSDVIAIDACAALLEEIEERKGDLPVRTVLADMSVLANRTMADSADVITCMGDSLSHLPSRADVADLLLAVRATLREGGRFVVTYRDLSVARQGADCFHQVHATEDRILTCSLEYQPLHVQVHDRLQRRILGGWMVESSSYPKLRLAADGLALMLMDAGFDIEHQETQEGMTTMVARVVSN